jgi:hypothetical protein
VPSASRCCRSEKYICVNIAEPLTVAKGQRDDHYLLRKGCEGGRDGASATGEQSNYLHIYDFRVQKGYEHEFIKLFEEFDYSDGNPMHKSSAQVKDGVLCRDTEDPQRFFLIAEWSDIEEHARIRRILANEIKPEFIKYIEGGKFIPKYVEVVSSTPDDILQKASGG